MSKINCETAGDLIPLYVDEILSKSSVELVEEHLAECDSCTAKVDFLKRETPIKDYDSIKPMKKFKDKLRRHKIITGVTIGICAAIMIGIFLYFFEYSYSYKQLKNDINVVSDSDGHIHIVYNGDNILFSKYDLKFTGIKNGKAQYTLLFYESVNFHDLWNYYMNNVIITKKLHDTGRKFEFFTVCPNDREFGNFCSICGNDDRYVENRSMWSEGGLEHDNIYNYDKPNPYTKQQYNNLYSKNQHMKMYEPYEALEIEISEVRYCRFNSVFTTEKYKSDVVWQN